MNYFGSYGPDQHHALSQLTPLVEQAIHCHEIGDYDTYLTVITPSLAQQLTREGFAKAHREVAPLLGQCQSITFIAALKRSDNPMLLFRAKYSHSQDDILINATIKNQSLPPRIEWFWIE